jgi:hypothetical protein
VRANDDVSVVIDEELLHEGYRRHRLPKELVNLSRRAVTEEQAVTAELDARGLRQPTHPALVLGGGLFRGVVVGDLRVVVVARIDVSAVAIVRRARERLLVISLDGGNVFAAEDLQGAIGMRSERAEVAEGPDGVHASFPRHP